MSERTWYKRVFYISFEILALLLLMAVLIGHPSLILDPTKLYSASIAHRLQTDALLRGHLYLSQSPAGYYRDFIWISHGLQQAWGMGVPYLKDSGQ